MEVHACDEGRRRGQHVSASNDQLHAAIPSCGECPSHSPCGCEGQFVAIRGCPQQKETPPIVPGSVPDHPPLPGHHILPPARAAIFWLRLFAAGLTASCCRPPSTSLRLQVQRFQAVFRMPCLDVQGIGHPVPKTIRIRQELGRNPIPIIQLVDLNGAVAENRTRDTCLEGRGFTPKLRPLFGGRRCFRRRKRPSSLLRGPSRCRGRQSRANLPCRQCPPPPVPAL